MSYTLVLKIIIIADGYGGVHGGMGFGTRNAEGERILEFGDGVGMAVCNTFLKEEFSKLITYQSGDNRSMIYYLMVRKTYSCLVKNVNLISSEDCVPQHRMVIGRLFIPMKPHNKIIGSKRHILQAMEMSQQLQTGE